MKANPNNTYLLCKSCRRSEARTLLCGKGCLNCRSCGLLCSTNPGRHLLSIQSSSSGRPVGAAMCHCWAKASFNWAQGDEKLLQLTLPFLSSCTSWPKPTPLSAAAGIEGSTRTLSLPLQLHLSQHQQCQGVPKKHQLINNSHRSNTLYIHYKSPQYRLSGQIPHYIRKSDHPHFVPAISCRTISCRPISCPSHFVPERPISSPSHFVPIPIRAIVSHFGPVPFHARPN